MTIQTFLLNSTRDEIKDFFETQFTHGAVGDDNTTPTPGDTTLGNEVFRKAIASFDKTTFTNKTIASVQITSAEANGNTIREGGFFDAVAAGNMLTHFLVNDIVKTSDISLYIDGIIEIEVIEDT